MGQKSRNVPTRAELINAQLATVRSLLNVVRAFMGNSCLGRAGLVAFLTLLSKARSDASLQSPTPV
jgi:hypothetical protein